MCSLSFNDSNYVKGEQTNIENIELIKLPKYDIIKNPYITDDMDVLKTHYTIMLDYIKTLESRCRQYKEQLERKDRRINVLLDTINEMENEE